MMPLLLSIVVNDRRVKGLAVGKFGGVGRIGSGRQYLWSVIIGHVLWAHWQSNGSMETRAKTPIKIQVLFEMRVKAHVFAYTGTVICIGKVDVIPVNDVHVPTHKPHLQAKDGRVVTFKG